MSLIMPCPSLLAGRTDRHRFVKRASTVFALAATLIAASGATLVHDFYLPMPEAQVKQTFDALETGVGTTLDSVFSVVVTGEGTVIYYDQWEDGYEIDLAHPTQASTKVWGNGNDADGIPPGYAHDPVSFPAGAVLALRNLVPLPRNPSTLLFDARDRIAATKALVVSHAAWATSPGSVLSGAVEVTATIDYGTSYVTPVGQDLTNGLFQYVGLMIMAEQDGTSVNIDTDGVGPNAPLTVALNRGESYLVNGGVKKGGSVNASKPVQVNLVIGRKGARYATDWFTLYPTNQWSDSYTTPVCTANNNNAAYVYIYNPGNTPLTISYNTRVSSGTFNVASNGVTQFLMPKSSGARFSSTGGRKFFALSTAGATPGSDAAYDWGFTLLPDDGLTTEAVVGWGPGSSDGSVNGSPAWVTPLAATRVYVDYNGDRNGPLTDPRGNKYDVHYDMVALESRRLYDPDKDQTAMRIYTVDGTPISAAWGEDPDVASPGNPYLDFGTTVLPFPVPVLQKTSRLVTDNNPPGLSVGDVIEYTIHLENRGLLPLGNVVTLDTLPSGVSYVPNTTTFNSNAVPDDVSGTPFPLDAPGYTIPVVLRGGSSMFTFQVTAISAGILTNVVNAVGYSLAANNVLQPGSSGTACQLNFTDSGTNTVTAYSSGANLYVRLADNDANNFTNSVQSVSVIVSNATRGDYESVLLTETGNNTGVFRNAGGLASSISTGTSQQDGILNVQPGDLIIVSRVDQVYGDTCSASAVILTPARNKVLYLSDPSQSMDRIDPVASGDNTTAQSIELGGGAIGTIGNDGTNVVAGANLVNFTYTTGTGANRLMLVSVCTDQAQTVSGITYNGVALTSVASSSDAGSTKPRVELFQLVSPASGAHPLIVTLAGAANVLVGVNTFSNVDQTTPISAFATNAAATTVTVASAPTELVYGTVCGAQAETDGAGQTSLWTTNQAGPGGIFAAGSTLPGAASATMTWTPGGGSAKIALIAVSIRPAASGGSGVTSFTQSPVFCQNFTMPAGGIVTITNFVSVTGGSMPANPNITAFLSVGSSNIITLSSPTYTAANSNLVWSGALPSGVTVPAGQAFQLVISNAQGGVSFRIDHDSAAKPSKVILPASSVIHVDSVGVYDAPYPGGSLVTAPASGSTLYVRTLVSDPFGNYDITGVGLSIDGPGVSDDLAVNLNNANVVAGDSCSKLYEYVWHSGATPGGYNIAATANEGTEGITDTGSTSVLLTFLDTGTPSTTEFTSGNNGSSTNAFPANASICVRVSDPDQNTNTLAVDIVSVTITTSSGDSENVVLTETGTNTGVFTACIPASTSGGGGTNDGILNAPVSSVVTVTYADPDDVSDVSTSTATIIPPPGIPGVTMNKTLVAPADGQAGVGESIQYNLQVVNSGSTVLTNVSVTDTFPSNKLSFVSASLPPDVVSGGALIWANVGPLGIGQATNILVSFTAIATSPSAVNSATANAGGGTTNTSGVGVTITHAALAITKTLLDPTNGPIYIGSNITFRIVVQNSGDTAIPSLPLEDTFSASCFQFVSATVTPDGVGAGSLLWTDITGVGSLNTNSSITIDVTLKAMGGCDPANNAAHADYAVDSHGDPVPPASSTVGVTTTSSRITGSVYDDLDQSGTLTGGDVGLGGVTIELFSDPNADGNPADGSLLRLTMTDPSGYYELLNLSTGAYVIVETDLPGYASSAPANNRIPVNLITLSTNANNNFFDYVPVVTNYATVAGTVWGDTNLNGTNDVSEIGVSNVLIELVQDVNTNGLADLGEPVTADTYTINNGTYSFVSVIPGHYVIRETDIFGYASTGDSRPPNDNQIGLLVTPGAVTNGNDFYDFSAGNTPTNDAPVAVNDSYSTPEDTMLIVSPSGVLTNDTDVDFDALSAVLINTTTNGTLNLSTNGGFIYTPNPNYNGPDAFTYRAYDGTTNSEIAIVSIIVTPVNDPPSANNQNVATPEDTATNLVLSGSDIDSSLTFAILNGPTNGVLSGFDTNTGTITYTPTANYNGPDFFRFIVNDGSLLATGSVSIVVTPVEDAPLANNLTVTTPEDTATNLVLTGSDVDGNALTFVIVTTPTNGVLSLVNTNTGALTYTPNANYNGGDSFTFRVNDGTFNSGVGTVFITVTPVNDGPVASNQNVTTPEDTSTNLVLLGSDVEGPVTYAILNGPTNGVLSGFDTNSGAITYTPATNYFGPDTFQFTVSDGSLLATGTVSITVIPLNDAPIANNQSVTTPEDTSTNLVLVGSDVESPITYAILSGPTHGALGTLNVNSGAVTYSPNTNYNGPDSFTFTVSDGSLLATGTVSITVLPMNDAPIANNQNVTTPEDTSTNLVLSGSDVESPVTYAILSGPVNGSLGALNTSSGAVTYSPNTNYNGADSFTFTVSDGSLLATGSVFITVTPVNDTPIANDQSLTTPEDASTNLVLIGSDVEGPVTYAILSGPTHGALGTLNINSGAVTYTPSTNYNGADGFTFTVSDGSLLATGTVSITVVPVNDAPIAIDDGYSVFKNTPLTLPVSGVLTNDIEPDGDSMTALLVSGPAHATSFTLNPNGSFNYTPVSNYVGLDTFTYRATDGSATSAVATATISIQATNTGPIAIGQNVTTPEDTSTNLVLSASDVDGNSLTFTIVSGPTNGVLSLVDTNNGTLTYTPSLNFNGGDSFTFRVNDGFTNSGIAIVGITVTPVNDAPIANNQNVTTPEDTSTNLVLVGSDIEGPVTYAILVGPTNGALSSFDTNTGAITYTPATNYNGADAFQFTVSDGSLLATGSVFITVLPVNDGPVANDLNVTTPEDTSTNLVLVGSDMEGPVTYAILVGPTNGALSGFNTNTGAITYSPTANYNGPDTFRFIVSDGSLLATGMVFITVAPVNDAPTANNQNVTTPEDTATNLVLVGSDLEGPVTYAILSGPTHGSLGTLNINTGDVNYTPATNYNGADSFTFTVSDGSLLATGTVSITVLPLNDAPIANNQSVTIPEDTSTNLVLVGSDVESPVTYSILSGPTHGSLGTLNVNSGAVSYTPNTNYNGADTFTFTVSDGSLLATGTVSITITPVNDAPIANNQNVTTPEDTSTNLVLVGSDVDSAVTYAILSGPTHGVLGTLDINTGAVTYTPSTNYNGADGFTFTVSDGSLLATGAVFITVTPVNDTPTVLDDSYNIFKNATLTAPVSGVLTNDSDVDGNPLTAILVLGPAHAASFTLNPNGSFTYTPVSNYVGLDSFTYRATDGLATSIVATATIAIAATNTAPVAFGQNVTTPEDTATNLVLSASDPDGNPLTFIIVSAPTNGVLSLVDTNTGTLTYTPNSNFNGGDSFTFQVNDGFTNSGIATVGITVTPVNDAPLANNQNVTTPEDTSTNLVLIGSDVEGPVTYAILVGPTNGALSGFDTNTGAITYSPASNYNGPDAFQFTVSDGSLLATGAVFLTVTPVNDGPIANNQNVTIPEDTSTNLVLVGSDLDGPVTYAILSGAINGTLGTLNTNTGAVTYTPSTNYNGPDSFAFIVSDGSLLATGTVFITVTPANDTPLVVDDNYSIFKNATLAVPVSGVLTNDWDVDGNPLTALLEVVPSHAASFTLNPNGSFTYTPVSNYVGLDSFTYRATDGSATSVVATATISIQASNTAPVAFGQNVTMPEDTATNLVLSASDSDGNALTFTIVSAPTNGLLSLVNTNTGTLTYAPNANFNGSDSFTFQVNDGFTNSGIATVGITVTPVNDTPVANNQNVTTPEDTSTNLVLVGSDVEGPVTYAILVGPTNGALSGFDTNTGAITYSPVSNYNGPDAFQFTVSDGALLATGTVFITVTPINDAPVANNQNVTIPEDTFTNLVLAGSDVDGPITYAILSGPINGTLGTLNTNTGAVTYSPNGNYNGADSFSFTVSDGSLQATGTVSITILPVNDAPIANNQNVTILEDTFTNLVVVGSDIEGPVTYAILNGPTNGALGALDTNTGAVTYTPNTNYNGADSFTFTASDGSLLATGTVSVTILPINDAPIANNQSVTTPEDTSTNLVLVGSDVEGPVTYAILSGPTQGTLGTLNVNSGAVTYTPNTNYNGPDSFTFTVSDGSLLATGTVSIAVVPVNDPPVANDLAVFTPYNTATNLVVSGSDVESTVTFAVLDGPTHGTLGILDANTGAVTYTPNNGYFGPDVFHFTVSDGSLLATGTVTITVISPTQADVSVSKSGTVNAIAGSTLTYNIAVTNLGGATSTNVLVNDQLPAGLTFIGAVPANATVLNNLVSWPAFNLPSGASSNFTVTALAAQGGIYTNIASGGASTSDPNPGNNDGSSTNSQVVTIVSPSADVAIRKTGPANGLAGANLTFNITATNNGPSIASNVVVMDQLPVGFIFVSAVPSTVAISNNLVSWPAFTLANGASSNFTITARAADGGVYTNVAFSSADTSDPDPSNNNGSSPSSVTVTAITPQADVAILKIGSPSVLAGSTVTYGITATNAGPSTASNVVVRDFMPAGMTFQNASGSYTLSGNAVIWSSINLPSGSIATFTVTLLTGASGTYTNIASSTADTPDANLSNNNGSAAQSVVVTVVNPVADVAVFKAGPANVTNGATFSYTITVTNSGPSAAANVVVKDFMPANVSFISASAGGTPAANVVTWPTIGSLPSGGSTNFTLTVVANVLGAMTNIANATSPTLDSNQANNDGSATGSRVITLVGTSSFGWQIVTNVFNPQTGLYMERVVITNNSGVTAAALRVYTTGLRSGVSLQNASGTNVGKPYVLYNAPLAAGESVSLWLEFFSADRKPFTNGIEVEFANPVNYTPGNGTPVSGLRIFLQTYPAVGEPMQVVEFPTIPGRSYMVLYGSSVNSVTNVAVPNVRATANAVQWIDAGPPKTATKPSTRYYRVIQLP